MISELDERCARYQEELNSAMNASPDDYCVILQSLVGAWTKRTWWIIRDMMNIQEGASLKGFDSYILPPIDFITSGYIIVRCGHPARVTQFLLKFNSFVPIKVITSMQCKSITVLGLLR